MLINIIVYKYSFYQTETLQENIFGVRKNLRYQEWSTTLSMSSP